MTAICPMGLGVDCRDCLLGNDCQPMTWTEEDMLDDYIINHLPSRGLAD